MAIKILHERDITREGLERFLTSTQGEIRVESYNDAAVLVAEEA